MVYWVHLETGPRYTSATKGLFFQPLFAIWNATQGVLAGVSSTNVLLSGSGRSFAGEQIVPPQPHSNVSALFFRQLNWWFVDLNAWFLQRFNGPPQNMVLWVPAVHL